jgi:hypothetical protein
MELRFRLSSFLVRWLALTALVMATYNPSGYSYYHWLFTPSGESLTAKYLIGSILSSVYLPLIVTVLRALGISLSFLLISSLTALYFFITDLIPIDPASIFLTMFVLISISVFLAIGISFAFVRQRLAGQVTAGV